MVGKFHRIETDRLIVDYGTVEDYKKIHEYNFNDLQNTFGIMRLTKNNPRDVESWFGENIEDWYSHIESQNHYQVVVFLKESNKPIADIGFDRIVEDINAIEISCWLHPKYWGNGYMTEALISTMNYIYDQGYDNIIAGYFEGNDRSKKLQKRLGFIPFGIEYSSSNYGKIKSYKNILSKEKFLELYGEMNKSKEK